jgi:formylglycine-generating enzyme required for sulfatase activity
MVHRIFGLLLILIAGAACPPAEETMQKIAAGSFNMGCDESKDTTCQAREKPKHEVKLDEYEIDTTEVTAKQYKACVEADGCEVPATCVKGCNYGAGGKDSHPVNNVTWTQADAYCRWAGKRLCTEAEWEKAARGTDGRKFPWGDQDATCKYTVMAEGGNGCGTDATMAVGSKAEGASFYKALDMAGNVWEWVADLYSSTYYNECGTSCSNPQGPATGDYRVIRGGCYVSTGNTDLRASARAGFAPDYKDTGIGIRCCR